MACWQDEIREPLYRANVERSERVYLSLSDLHNGGGR
jgi:hypothetical protein